jgi:hypothetical protein
MTAPRREVDVHLEERRLDEEPIGVARQGDGFFDIALMTAIDTPAGEP